MKFVKVYDLGTKQLDLHKQKRQLGAGGSQDSAQPSSPGGGELGGSSWQPVEDWLKKMGREEVSVGSRLGYGVASC